MRRGGSFAANPGESVLQPGIITSLFPHLGDRKVHEFRWVFIGGVLGVFVLFIAGLITAALTVAVMLLPILYLLYIYEAQVYKDEPLFVLLGLAGATVGIGIGVTIGTNALIDDDTKLAFTVTGSSLVLIGVLIPLIQEAAKPILPLLLRYKPIFRDETMDGLVFGIAAGLGFGVGESFVRLSDVLTQLPVRTDPGDWIYPLITTAVFLPLMQATTTGLVCAALWRFGLGKVDMLALGAILAAVGGHIAFSLVSQVFVNHGWSQLIILGWQALVDAALLVAMRYVLHVALIEEAQFEGAAEKFCSYCQTTVLAEGFCPRCGQAFKASPYQVRKAAKPAGAAAAAGGEA
jgi:RsiW-degrading membrane proteinase PrsW (M82 family)